jgi:uncharacterized membrane protein
MDGAHLHLLLNHYPIVGSIIAFMLLFVGFFMKNKSVINAALVIAVLIGLITIPVFLTGEAAEHKVEDLAGTSEFYLEEHEDIGKTAFLTMNIAAILSLIALVVNLISRKTSRIITAIALLAIAATVAIMVYTGYLGGKIRRPELRETAMVQPAPQPACFEAACQA